MEIIKMYNYEMVDLRGVIRKIDEGLKKNEEVALDFSGIAGINFLELEEMFTYIFSNFSLKEMGPAIRYEP